MKIAVLSGKGGTGKTFVSVNLAAAAKNSCYADCDVEEPNGHLFFKPENKNSTDVKVKIPVIDESQCTGCRTCVDFCEYNALAYVNKVMLFETLCHSCGGCKILCPNQAISEREKTIGVVNEGYSNGVKVITGCLNTGEITGVPLIKTIISKFPKDDLTIIDCPPGSACMVMESIKESDYCIMVAEPTLFGVHNMAMVYELVKLFKKPYGVVINKSYENNMAEDFCNKNNIKIIEKIPYDNELGKIISEGKIAVEQDKKYNEIFNKMLNVVFIEAL